jgi:chaperone required for assembly of F1-ATPase
VTQRAVAKFYKTVDVAKDKGNFRILLDGKSVKTPQHAALAIPNREMAEAIAEEWRAQGNILDPATMPLTRLAFAAIDVAPTHRTRLQEEILAFGNADLICYRAESPAALVARQSEAWDPLLDWTKDRFGTRPAVGAGIAFIAQSAALGVAYAAAVARYDDFALVALHGAASLIGSLALALALAEHRLVAAEAFALSRLDEDFQAEVWGRDAEAEARAARLADDLGAIERFLRLSSARS